MSYLPLLCSALEESIIRTCEGHDCCDRLCLVHVCTVCRRFLPVPLLTFCSETYIELLGSPSPQREGGSSQLL